MDRIFESRTGKILVILYTLLTIVMYVVSFVCGAETCGLYIVAPIMPWALILTEDLGLGFPLAVYPIFILLNASVAYIVGAGLEWLYELYRERQEDAKKPTLEHNQST